MAQRKISNKKFNSNFNLSKKVACKFKKANSVKAGDFVLLIGCTDDVYKQDLPRAIVVDVSINKDEYLKLYWLDENCLTQTIWSVDDFIVMTPAVGDFLHTNMS